MSSTTRMRVVVVSTEPLSIDCAARAFIKARIEKPVAMALPVCIVGSTASSSQSVLYERRSWSRGLAF